MAKRKKGAPIITKGERPDILAREAHACCRWRPTVTCIVTTSSGHMCVTKKFARRLVTIEGIPEPVETRRISGDLPKGGVHSGESVEAAVYRELKEEISLPRHLIRCVRYIGSVCAPFNKHNQGLDGFTKGKLHLIYVVEIDSSAMRLCRPLWAHKQIGLRWMKDPWNHFPPKSFKAKMFRVVVARRRLSHRKW